MDIVNIILLVLIFAIVVVDLWWAFNTVHKIEIQKQFAANSLTSIAKLWRRAKFVPEDARERESLYLYRDFLRKFDDTDDKYPIIVKNGGVRCMTRREYDRMCGLKNTRPVSILMLLVSLMMAGGTITYNIIKHNILLGIVLALIPPVLQIFIAIFVARFNKEKNGYREKIFSFLRENSIDFLRITKPFIIIDAYPQQFGKKDAPRYQVIGELSETQIAETRQFITEQKEAETKVVLKSVDNQAEIDALTKNNKKAPKAAPQPEINNIPNTPNEPEPPVVDEKSAAKLTPEAEIELLKNLVDARIDAEEARIKAKIEQLQRPLEVIEDLPPVEIAPEISELTTDSAAPETPIDEPSPDDFSLDSIGLALDAEIAKRNRKKN